MQNIITQLQKTDWIIEISKYGNSYLVGGCVRDSFLDKKNKDIDIVIEGVDYINLVNILNQFGILNQIGKSFSVIKFKPFNDTEEYDISTCRTDIKISQGHNGFEIISNSKISIIEDLKRRDLTCNAIAINILTREIVDPFNGLSDIENKILKPVDCDTFMDDPLRMLRVINFASRFGFEIEESTFKLIQENAHSIKEISPERILIEFEKIVSKGNTEIGANLLFETGLYEAIFQLPKYNNIPFTINYVKTIGEFLYLLFNARKEPFETGSDIYKNKMHGEINTFKEMKGYELGTRYFCEKETFVELRMRLFKMYNISSACFKSKLFDSVILGEIELFTKGIFPKTLKELKVNGEDIMKLGFQGPEISKVFESILIAIFDGTIKNDKKSIIKFLKNK